MCVCVRALTRVPVPTNLEHQMNVYLFSFIVFILSDFLCERKCLEKATYAEMFLTYWQLESPQSYIDFNYSLHVLHLKIIESSNEYAFVQL